MVVVVVECKAKVVLLVGLLAESLTLLDERCTVKAPTLQALSEAMRIAAAATIRCGLMSCIVALLGKLMFQQGKCQ